MRKYIRFDVDKLNFEDDSSDPHFSTARILAFSSGLNRHDLFCSEETLKRTSNTIYNKPIVYSVDNRFGDFGTHTELGKSLIAGYVVPDSATFETLDDGRTGLYVEGKIWKKYAPLAMQIFEKDGGNKKVSVEMMINQSDENAPYSGESIEMNDFEYSAVTILGDLITEASPGANIAITKFSKEDIDESIRLYTEKVFSKYDDIDFSIPKRVKVNAQKGLDLKNGTSVCLAMAKYLIKNEKINPKKIKQLYKYFSKHSQDNFDDKSSNAWINWMLCGGDAGWSWSKKIFKQIDDRDSKRISFFSDGAENMNALTVEEFAKEDLGKGEKLEVDKSQKALSNTSWGNVNKASLRDKVLSASNYKSLVHDVFMKVESGWEDAPSQHLKYPVMQISGGKLVYNRYGLSSALAYAKKEGETDVVNRITAIYGKLGLNDNEKEEVDESMSKNLNKDFADENAEEEKKEIPVEEKKEEEMAIDKKEKEETPDEEKKESPEEEKKEQEKGEEFSLDAFLDVDATLAFLQAETETYTEMADKMDEATFAMCKGMAKEELAKKKDGKEFSASKLCAGLYATMCKMATALAEKDKQLKTYMAEKEEVEKEKFAEKVEETLAVVANAFSDMEMSELKEEAKKFTFATFSQWEKEVYAKAFLAKKEKKDEKVVVYAMPFNSVDGTAPKDLWGS